MSPLARSRWLTLIASSLAAHAGGGALAATTATQPTAQVLDHVATFGKAATLVVPPPDGSTAAIEMSLRPDRSADYAALYARPVNAGGFGACQLTGNGGLVCLDGKAVRQWPNATRAPGSAVPLFSCANAALGLDKKSDTCTGLTVDLSGALWLSGKKSSTYSLLKLVRRTCTPGVPGQVQLVEEAGYPGSGGYCAEEFASGRPYFEDIGSEEGETVKGFRFGTGVSGVQTRNALVYFGKGASAPATVNLIASGKSELGLAGSEQVLSTSLLKVGAGYYFVYATSTGKLRVVNTDASPRVSDLVFDVRAYRGTASPPAGCPAVSADRFGVRASLTTDKVYVSDRAYCRILVLQPDTAVAGSVYGFRLKVASEQRTGQVSATPMVLSTGTLNPESPVVAPGIFVDLGKYGYDCGDCALLQGAGGTTAVQLAGVSLQQTGQSGMTLFQIQNIPDCRDPDTASDARCVAAGLANVVRDCAPNVSNPSLACDQPALSAAQKYLNVTPLMPSEVREAFPALPAMWISPQYRGRLNATSGVREFDALLGIPESNVQFTDTFRLDFELDALVGRPTDCHTYPPGSVVPTAELVQEDVVTTVSERFLTVSNGVAGNIDTLVNTGCGGAAGSGSRWSIYTYDVEMNPDTVAVVNGTKYLSTNDDAVFAKLLDGLYDDLGRTQNDYVCGGLGTTVLTAACPTLLSGWLNGRDKLTKCIGASTQPKQSSGDQNCTAFRSQLANYQSTLDAVGPAPAGQDIANRIGELESRAKIVSFIFEQRFLPSIPEDGFCENPGSAACGMTPLP